MPKLCPECNCEVFDNDPVCPTCGFPIDDSSDVQGKQEASTLKFDEMVGSSDCGDNSKETDTSTHKMERHSLETRAEKSIPSDCPASSTCSKNEEVDKIEEASSPNEIAHPRMNMKRPVIAAGILMAAILILAVLFATHVICIHSWKAATCTEPETCTICGETKGEPLGHTKDGWSTTKIDYVNGVQQESLTCSLCGNVINTRETPIVSLMNDGLFSLSIDDLTKRLDGYLEDMDYSYSASTGNINGQAATAVLSNGYQQIAGAIYLDASETALSENEILDEAAFTKIVLLFNDDADEEDVATVTVALVQAVDPSLSFEEARDTAASCLDNPVISRTTVSGSSERNGIHYGLAQLDGDWLMTVTPA